jgi:hypothetical protein
MVLEAAVLKQLVDKQELVGFVTPPNQLGNVAMPQLAEDDAYLRDFHSLHLG